MLEENRVSREKTLLEYKTIVLSVHLHMDNITLANEMAQIPGIRENAIREDETRQRWLAEERHRQELADEEWRRADEEAAKRLQDLFRQT